MYINANEEIYVSVRFHLKNYLFLSKDMGETWSNITPEYYLKEEEKVNDIILIFGKEETSEFIGLISRDSFFLSNDRGETWDRIEYPNNTRVFLARRNPFSENEFMLAAFNGIFFTDNYGKDLKHITEVFSKDTESSAFIIKDLTFTGTPGVIYFASYDSLFTTQNGGFTWKKVITSRKFYYQIEVDPYDDLHIFAGISNGGILESFNGGYSWEYLDKRLPFKPKKNLRCFFLKINPFNPNLIFSALEVDDREQENIYSSDGGKTWDRMKFKEPLDSNSIVIFQKNLIYLGTSNGKIYISKDNGVNWEPLKFNIEVLLK